MKKNIFISIIILFFIFLSFANDIEELKLKGKIKEYTTTYYNHKYENDSIIKGDKNSIFIVKFNKYGYITEIISNDQIAQNEIEIYEYKYFKNKIDELIIKSGDKIREKRKYKYNQSNLLEEILFSDENNEYTTKHKFIYDEKNKLIKMEAYDGQMLWATTIYTYDENNNLIEELKNDAGIMYKTTYQDGKIASFILDDSNSISDINSFYEYKEIDKFGNPKLVYIYQYPLGFSLKYIVEYEYIYYE